MLLKFCKIFIIFLNKYLTSLLPEGVVDIKYLLQQKVRNIIQMAQ